MKKLFYHFSQPKAVTTTLLHCTNLLDFIQEASQHCLNIPDSIQEAATTYESIVCDDAACE